MADGESLPVLNLSLSFLFILLTLSSSPQTTGVDSRPSAWKSFFQLSGPEKCWVITHPFVANKARKISYEARVLSDEMKNDTLLDGDSDGGRVDAFRHTYWMARLSQTFCWKKAVKLGKAHEKGNYRQFKKGRKDEELVLPDSASSVMDLHNNDIGISIGCENPGLAKDELKMLVVKSIISGRTLIVSKNEHGIPLDCSGKLIEADKYIQTWNIPKCLISSGYKNGGY